MRAGLVLLLLSLVPAPAWAHGRSSGGAQDGIAIDNLTHGQMVVIDANAGAILGIARQQARTDPTFRRLMNFAALQRTYCLWGLVPGSLQDEESPFNECSHAYLATLRTLLLHMAQMPDRATASAALIDKVEREMIARQASLTLCQYSGEAFNTAEVVVPRWRDILFHPSSLLACGGAAFAVVGGGWLLLMPRTRRPLPSEGRSEPQSG